VAVDARDLRQAAGRFATGVTVVTTVTGGVPHAMTANSFVSVSLDPLLVLVSVDRGSRWHEAVTDGGVFGVSVLSAAQEHLSRWFADRSRPADDAQFAEVDTELGEHTSVPLIVGALACFECRVTSMHDAGDHSLVVGEVLSIREAPRGADPLVFFEGGYHSLTS
jgi:flavin reductase (DIM6/NTAB) family NADH-FMN oxidoreductase RutF